MSRRFASAFGVRPSAFGARCRGRVTRDRATICACCWLLPWSPSRRPRRSGRTRARSWRRPRSARAPRPQHYEGTLQVFDAKGKISDKRWTFDRLGSHGSSKSILRFTAPPEVKGVALLVVNHPDRASDQWMWTPAIQRDRRVALQDRSQRFFGTDFSFEDLEERDVDQYDYTHGRRGDAERGRLLADRRQAAQDQDVAVHPVARVGAEGQLRLPAGRELHQVRGRAASSSTATSRTCRASGPAGRWR